MESSRTCSTCESIPETEDFDYTQTEQIEYTERSYYRPVQQQRSINYIRNMSSKPYYTPQVQQQPQQQRVNSYKIQPGYENYGYNGNFMYSIPTPTPYYPSQNNTMSHQHQLAIHNRAASELMTLRYIMPQQPQQQQASYYQYPTRLHQPRQIVHQYIEYINDTNIINKKPATSVQHQMCQTSSTATSLFNPNHNHNNNNDQYNYNCQNMAEVTSYDHSQQSQMKKVASIESNLRFINMNAVGATANIPSDEFEESKIDYTDTNIANNNNIGNNKNFLNSKLSRSIYKKRKVAIISIIVGIFVAVLVLASTLGIVFSKAAFKNTIIKASMGSNLTNITSNMKILNHTKHNVVSTSVLPSTTITISKEMRLLGVNQINENSTQTSILTTLSFLKPITTTTTTITPQMSKNIIFRNVKNLMVNLHKLNNSLYNKTGVLRV